MTQEEKDLLLQDLCSRLPYGVKIELTNNGGYHHENIAKRGDKTVDTLKGFTCKYFTIHHDNPLDWDWVDSEIEVKDIKPYLFPLSSMTDEQIMQSPTSVHVCDLENLRYDSVWTELNSRFTDLIDLIDWLNKNHFDYRGLIPMDLAIDCTNLNIY